MNNLQDEWTPVAGAQFVPYKELLGVKEKT